MPYSVEITHPLVAYLARSETQRRKTPDTRDNVDENVVEINRRLAALGVSIFLHEVDAVLREFGYYVSEDSPSQVSRGSNVHQTLKIRDLYDTAAKGHLIFSELRIKNF